LVQINTDNGLLGDWLSMSFPSRPLRQLDEVFVNKGDGDLSPLRMFPGGWPPSAAPTSSGRRRGRRRHILT